MSFFCFYTRVKCLIVTQCYTRATPDIHFSVMTTSTPEKQDGLKALSDAIEVIQNKITSLGGVFNVQMAVSL